MALRTIRSKLLLSYLLVVAIPLGLLGTFLMNRLGHAVSSRIEQSERANLRQLEVNLETYLSSLLEISRRVYLNEQISFYVGRRYPDPGVSARGFYEIIKPLFTHYRTVRPGIERLTIATENPTLLANDREIVRMHPDHPAYPSYAVALATRGAPLWSFVSGSEPVLRLARSIGSQAPDLAVFILDVNENELYRFIREAADDVVVTIATPAGRIVSSNDRSRLGRAIDELGVVPSLKGSFAVGPQTHEWSVWAELDVAAVNAEVRAVWRYGVAAALAVFVATIALAIPLSRRLTKGVTRLSQQMARLQQGDFSARIEVTGDDEIGRLQRSFNTMVGELDRLIETNYRSEVQRRELELRKREAEFLALQSQVDPHFLFNTLEVLVQGIEEERAETAAVLRKLAQLTRRRLQSGSDLVPLSEELVTVEEYLSILMFRLEDRLKYTVRCPLELRALMLPRFSVQPIVENAVTHGLAPTKEGGTVLVTVERSRDSIHITVDDDGEGIDRGTLETIRGSLRAERTAARSDHIGLVNVHKRLQLHYGADAGILISSCRDRGTSVKIVVPGCGLQDVASGSR
jgi:two-component system sensor histidine kinase YesM